MKNFFQKNGIMMLAAVTVVAVLLCVASALSSQTGFLQNAGGVIASPFRAVGSAVSGWFSSMSQRFEDVEALQQENADLKKENAELQRQLDQAKIDSEENQRLRNLLNLRQQRRDFTFESAVIVDRSTSNWSRVMTLNKGTSSGIAVGNCVVDDQGNLVGVIPGGRTQLVHHHHHSGHGLLPGRTGIPHRRGDGGHGRSGPDGDGAAEAVVSGGGIQSHQR